MSGHCLDKGVEAQLRSIAGNNICADCDGKLPQWASVSFGIFMCLECSGRHRALGVHISFVRSVSMDSWTEKQIKLMKAGGNDACNAFLESYGINKTTPIAQKYNSPAALLYKDRLLASVEGRPLPSELPKIEASAAVYQGSDPLPGESESEYVARQRKLQEEAKERLRQKFGSTSGLSSGGTMQGIGSDSSYRPGTTNDGIADKALSVLQSSWSFLGEAVNKSMAEDSQQQYKEVAAKGWAAAVDLWSRAAEATTDLVQNMNKPDEEMYKFPRPSHIGGSTNSSREPQPSTSVRYEPRTGTPRTDLPVQTTSSWDEEDGALTKVRRPSSRASSVASPKVDLPAPHLSSREPSPALSLSNPADMRGPTPPARTTSVSPVVGTATPKSKTADAPTGDDFFATFGV